MKRKRIVKLFVIILGVGLSMASCGIKERSLEELRQDAEKFKSELPKDNVVIGECIDSLVQKIYYTNRVSPCDDAGMAWQGAWQGCYLEYCDDIKYPIDVLKMMENRDLSATSMPETFIKVYDLRTQTISDVLPVCTDDGNRFDRYDFGIRFSHCANGKLIFSVPSSRDGMSIYAINIYTDELFVIDDGSTITHVDVVGNRLSYNKSFVVNEDEAECVAYYERVTHTFSIDL